MFTQKTDILDYVNNEKIKCLECGKSYRGLGNHILRAHGISAADYKHKYGIPMYVGLMAPDLKIMRSRSTKELHSQGKIDIKAPLLKQRKDKSAYRSKPKCTQDKFFAAGKKASASRAYPIEVFEEYLTRLQTVRSIESVSSDDDMPCVALVYKHAIKDEEYAKRLKAITKHNKSELIKRLRAGEKAKRGK